MSQSARAQKNQRDIPDCDEPRSARMSGTPWRTVVLLPLGEDLVRHLLAPSGADIVVPAARDRDGLHAALADADVVVGDSIGSLAMDADAVAAAPRMALLQMPSVGVDS